MLKRLLLDAVLLFALFSVTLPAQPAPLEPAVAEFKRLYEAELAKRGVKGACTYTIVDRRGDSAVMKLDCAGQRNVCWIGIPDVKSTDVDGEMTLLVCKPKPIGT